MFLIVKLVFLVFVMKPIVCVGGKGKELYKKMSKGFYYEGLIGVFLESYIVMLMIGLMSMFTPDVGTGFTFQAFSLGGFLLIILVFLIPGAIVYILLQPLKRL